MHQIKILSPIDHPREAEPLIKAGADEFYCGMIIGKKIFSSKRDGKPLKENMRSVAHLLKTIKIIKKYKKNIYLNLNFISITYSQLPFWKQIIKKLNKYKIDGFILANFDLINILKDENIKIIASSFFETKNIETVKLLKKAKTKRIILDRQITLRDIDSIKKAFPEIELETFIMETGCRSLSSYCTFHNLKNKKNNDFNLPNDHLCVNRFYSINKGRGSTDFQLERLTMPRNTCGICALYHFNQKKIKSVKIVGRGFALSRKIRNVKFVKDAIQILELSKDKKDFYDQAQNLFKETFGYKCERKFCYYPHFFNE